MGKLNLDNLKKTIYYLKRNGWKNTLYAVAERLQKKDTDGYTYVAPADGVLVQQRQRSWEQPVTFSILVPLYHTPEKYFREMVETVRNQTYPYFQLILLDAGEEKKSCTLLQKIVAEYADNRICYYKLDENKGIAENTNAGLEYATGEYIALLDHDDVLTLDALYEFAEAIEAGKKRGVELQMLYSDEDKCDGDGKTFYEPHYKKDFDFELLLTNNYICHFTAVKAELFQELQLRGEYNGAQDFDLVLRVAGKFLDRQEVICHVPKVLYHWRCHRGSTAANPESKSYAYEAGRRAVESFVTEQGWNAEVSETKHVGFYRVWYTEGIFKDRPQVGAQGGDLIGKDNTPVAGMMDEEGNLVFGDLWYGFSGYMNRAHLMQQAQALDLRRIMVNPACEELMIQLFGENNLYRDKYQRLQVKPEFLKEEKQAVALSLKFSKLLRDAGYLLVWDPYLTKILLEEK